MTLNSKKDYYRILGVQENADDIVIRASYLALLKRYNLDDWKGDKQQAIKMLADINEAYSVLKDRYERLEYNSNRQNTQQEESVEIVKPNLSSEEIEAAWLVACNYYNDLDVLYFNLVQISEQVAKNFKFAILSSKDYQNRNKLAAKLELDYLRSQFGNDQDLIEFGKELILEEDAKDAVSELNHVVNVMGNAVHAQEVIDKISKKYQTQRYKNELHKIRQDELRREEEKLRKAREEEKQRKKLQQEELESEEGRKKAQVFFLVFIVVASVFYFAYWYGTNMGLPQKDRQQNSQISTPSVSTSSCDKYLEYRKAAIKAINSEAAEKNAIDYENCSGLKLSQSISLEELFAAEEASLRSMGDELYFFPSGASVNKRAAYSINLGWKIISIEESIPTFNSRQNLEKAYDLMQYAYNKGHPEAASNIGYIFEKGLGFSKNIGKAVYWYKKSIDMGEPHSPQAEYQLARIYQSGEDGYQKISEAKELYYRVIEKTQSRDYANLSAKYRELAQKALSELR